jgi:hypothetical protein
MRTIRLAAGLLLLVGCSDLAPVSDSGDSSGSWGGCCFTECSDGSSSQVVADSWGECETIGEAQCQGNGLELVEADYDEECVDCAGCR